MHALKTILKGTFFLATFLLAVVVLTLAALWAKPSLILNEANVKRALSTFAPGVSAKWENFAWSFAPIGLTGKKMELAVTGLCVKASSGALDTCITELRLDLDFSLSGFSPRVTELRTVLAHVHHFSFQTEPGPEEKSASPLPDLRIPALSSVFPQEQTLPNLGTFELRLDRLKFGERGSVPLEGTLKLEKIPSSAQELALHVQAALRKGPELALGGEASLAGNASRLSVKGKFLGEVSGWQLDVPLEGSWSEALNASLRPVAKRKKETRKATLDLLASSRELILNASAIELPGLWPGRRVQADSCRLSSRLDDKLGYPAASELSCTLSAKASGKRALVKTVKGELRLKSSLHQAGKAIHADIELTGSSRQDLFAADVNGKGRLEFTGNWEFQALSSPDFRAVLKIPSFAELRKAVAGSHYEIPAPFYPLEGPVSLQAVLGKPSGRSLPFDVTVDSQLKGATQSFVTSSKATVLIHNAFTKKMKIDIDAHAHLADVLLEAPPLRLEEPPQAMLDKRFQTSHERKKELEEALKATPSNVSWKLKISSGQPVRIRTNLLEAPIPLAVDLRLSSQSRMAGTIEVKPMPVEVFHRKAEVETVKLTFRENSSVTEVNGLLLYRNPEVLVRILILGSAQEPRVVFESDPPLSQQQVVSLLLFNKSVQELNEEEASSSASMSQALADGAFGLFSLLFLSSTPVESVGYDPVSDTYSVRLRVGSKTTVSVASDTQGDRQYGIRRRIGRRWALRTELQRNEDRGNTSLLTLLEWFNRF